MNPSAKLNTFEEQKTLQSVYSKIAPAVVEMVVRKDSGEITLYFHEGQFKRAKKTTTVQ